MIKDLPANRKIESELINCLMSFPADVDDIAQIIQPEDFDSEQLGAVFKAIAGLRVQGDAVTFGMLAQTIAEQNKSISTVDAMLILSEIAESQFVDDAMSHAQKVKQYSDRRKLIKWAGEIATKAYRDDCQHEDLVQLAQTVPVGETAETDSNLKSPERYIEEFLEDLDRDQPDVIKSRFANLNNRIMGYERQASYWFAAAEKMGKSTALMSEAHHFAKAYPDKVGVIFSLEMSHRLCTRRLVSIDTGVTIDDLKTRTLSEDDWAKVLRSAAWIKKSQLCIDTTAGLSPAKMRRKLNMIKARYGQVDYIILDYFQIMNTDKGGELDNNAFVSIANELQTIIKEFDCVLIGGCQVVSKAIGNRADKRPMLHDIRGSSAIQANAFGVFGLYRDSYYNPDLYIEGDSEERETELITMGLREGRQGTDKLLFFGECSRFEAAQEAKRS